MEKQIKIYNYRGEPVEVVIENFENLFSAFCEVKSGDEILMVIYKGSGDIKTFDSCPGGRLVGYDDGMAKIPLDKIDKLSEIPNSYDMLDYFWDLEKGRL